MEHGDLDNHVDEGNTSRADHTMPPTVENSAEYNYDEYYSSLVDRFGSIPEAESFFTEYDDAVAPPFSSEDDDRESVNSNSTDDDHQLDDIYMEDSIYTLPDISNSHTSASFNANDEKFKKACHDLINLSSEFVENDKIAEQNYIDMCDSMKILFKSHDSMLKTVIKINNRLTGSLIESTKKVKDLCAEIEELKSTCEPPKSTVLTRRGFFKKLIPLRN